MTEAEWLNETGCSQWMMCVLQERKLPRTKAGRRKLRLFACGCCRAAWDHLPDGRLRAAVVTAERFADGLASRDELAAARAAVSWMREDSAQPAGTPPHARVAIDMAVGTTEAQAYEAAFLMTAMSLPLAKTRGQERAGEAVLCDLIRCVFGNPFRPVPPLAASLLTWQGGLVVHLAQDIYDRRSDDGKFEWDRLLVLADALEEAGADAGDLLASLRRPGERYRGFWPIDLILGKG